MTDAKAIALEGPTALGNVDIDDETLRVKHPVHIRPDKLQEQRTDAFTYTLTIENTTQSATIDIGADNTLAIVTSSGDTAVYHARPEFDQFQQHSEQIAALQAELPDEQYSSQQIRWLYEKRTRKRNHSRNAAVKHAADWLLARDVDTVYVGDLSDVLDAHWSTTVNTKTHAFWSHGRLTDRITLTLGDVGITVNEISEADSSSECPRCGSTAVHRDGDPFRYEDCKLDTYSDVAETLDLV